MERKKGIFIVVLLMGHQLVFSQNISIYNAYIYDNMPQWKRVIDSLENINPKTNVFRLELLNYQYGYIGYCIGTKKNDTAKRYIQLAENHIKYLESKKYHLAEIYAYKSAFIGYEIGLHRYKAPVIGFKSIEYANKSIELDKENVLGYIQKANIEFYMPSVFGGSKKKAIEFYLKALKIMEQNAESINRNWNYLNLLSNIINAYITLEDYKNAKIYCVKTLKIAPNFNWVKKELYPQVLKKME